MTQPNLRDGADIPKAVIAKLILTEGEKPAGLPSDAETENNTI